MKLLSLKCLFPSGGIQFKYDLIVLLFKFQYCRISEMLCFEKKKIVFRVFCNSEYHPKDRRDVEFEILLCSK